MQAVFYERRKCQSSNKEEVSESKTSSKAISRKQNESHRAMFKKKKGYLAQGTKNDPSQRSWSSQASWYTQDKQKVEKQQNDWEKEG